MEYIRTDEADHFDIKYGELSESPVRGSTARFITNPIVDDAEADPTPIKRARLQRVNGRIVIDTTVPDGAEYRYDPPSCIVTGDPSVNDLTTDRWRNESELDRATERQLIQRIKGGDERAFRQLLEAFHYKHVIGLSRGYVPNGGYYASKKEKPFTVQLYEDLTSVACFELYDVALRFTGRGRLSTLARRRILGELSNEANYLRQQGYTSGNTVGRYSHKEVGRHTQTRLDRCIFSNLGAAPEELLKFQSKNLKRDRIYHSLQDAADALKRANNLYHSEVYSDGGEDDADRDDYGTNIKSNSATEPLDEYRAVYDAANPLCLSPQLGERFIGTGRRYLRGTVVAVRQDIIPGHRRVSAIIDFWIRQRDPRAKAKPNPRPVYPPCTVKPTGVVLRPADTPYWMEPRADRPIEKAGKPYDPDRREVALVRLKSGKTKRWYRQMRAAPDSSANVAWRKEYGARDWYSWMTSEQRKRNPNVGTKQTNGSAVAPVVVLQSRRSGKPRLHVSLRHLPESTGERFACARVAW
jgi:hypothetical protein